MICAYCKGRVMRADRKCPACGSTAFVEEEQDRRETPQPQPEPAKPQPPPQNEPPVYRTVYQTVYTQRPVSDRNRWIALLLCFFGGMIGLHRFYVGKIGTGILYILTAGVFGIGAVVDFFSILGGGFRDGDGMKLSA